MSQTAPDGEVTASAGPIPSPNMAITRPFEVVGVIDGASVTVVALLASVPGYVAATSNGLGDAPETSKKRKLEFVLPSPPFTLSVSIKLGLADLFGEYHICELPSPLMTLVQLPPSLSDMLVMSMPPPDPPVLGVVSTRRFPVTGSCIGMVAAL